MSVRVGNSGWRAAVLGAAALGACAPARPGSSESSVEAPAASDATPTPRRTPRTDDVPATPRDDDDGTCAPPPSPITDAAWTLTGYHPGPVLEDVLATGPRRERLVGVTRRQLCVSDDEGASWAVRTSAGATLDAPTLGVFTRDRALVLIAQGSSERPSPPVLRVSRDDGEQWTDRPLPAEAVRAGAAARVFSDRLQRLYVTTTTQLWMSDVDGAAWEGPRALPGRSARDVEACGDTLVARADLDREAFYFRSEDRGVTWRPFRLGALGLEAEGAIVRCVRWRGGIEAGRPPVPGWWSFDQGRTWEPSRYDLAALHDTRALDDDPAAMASRDLPRCATAVTGELTCLAPHRLVLPATDVPWNRERPTQREVHAPAHCDRLRRIDDRRVAALGRGCGFFVSHDLGGMWRAMSVHAGVAPGRGTGGFIDRDTAWRLEGGLWWTRDGGAHWTMVQPAHGHALAYGVFVDRDRGVFVQRDGWVIATEDGGARWRLLLRGDAPRIATAGTTILLTTADRALTSLDGGRTWRRGATPPAGRALDPTLVVDGERRRIDLSDAMRVVQQRDAVELVHRDDGTARREPLAHGLPRGWVMVAAHATGGVIDRILLSGGAVLQRRRDLAVR